MENHAVDGKGVCAMLGCDVPVVLAGMGGVARSELVAAVTAAGAFGFLGMVREPIALLEREVAKVRAAGHRAFGVNIIPAATERALLDRQLDAIIALQVPVVELFWDIDTRVVDRLREAGVVVVYQVGSVGEAVAAERAGAQIIVAQGVEAGGHVRGVVPLRDLLPAVVRAVSTPVLAAGGLAHGNDMAIAMAMGAEGVVLGTALMATTESFAHAYHQQRLVQAQASDTILTSSFHINWPPNAPVRVLRSAVTAIAAPAGEPVVIGEEEGRPIYLFSTDSPLQSMTGDFGAMALYAGTGVGAIDAIVPTDQRLGEFLRQAARAVPLIAPMLPADSSSVCFASEFSGEYMGHLGPEELADGLSEIAGILQEILRLALASKADDSSVSAPPFHADATPIAGWVLLLRQLCAEAQVRTVDYNFKLPLRRDIAQELSRRHALVRQTLATMLPRMPENQMRNVLAALARFMAATAPPKPEPLLCSGESQDAVGP